MAFENVQIVSVLNGVDPVTGYRTDASENDVVSLSLTGNLSGASTYLWRITGRPEYSVAGGGGPNPWVLGTGPTASFTIDPDDGLVLLDGSYTVECVINNGGPSKRVISTLIARTSGLTIAGASGGTRDLRKLGMYEALEDTGSINDVLAGWSTQLNRWLTKVQDLSNQVAGSQTLAATYNIGSTSAHQTMSLLDAKGGGITLNASGVGFTGASALTVVGTGGSTVVSRAGQVGIKTAVPLTDLHITAAGAASIRLQTTGPSMGFDIVNTGTALAFKNTTGPVTLFSIDATTGVSAPLGMGIGASAPTAAAFVMGAGSTVPVSAVNTGRFRYNESTQTFQMSVNGGAWGTFGAGTISISSTQMAFGTGTNTIGGDSDFTFTTSASIKSMNILTTGAGVFARLSVRYTATDAGSILNLNSATAGGAAVSHASYGTTATGTTGGFTNAGNGFITATPLTSGTMNLHIGMAVGTGSIIFYRGTAGSAITMELANNHNVVIGKRSMDNAATDGFPYIPSLSNYPIGTPTTFATMAPIVIDGLNNAFYFWSNSAWRAAESVLTFTSGLTRTANSVANDFYTGKGASQTLYGASDSGGSLTISSTAHATKGLINVGSNLTLYNSGTQSAAAPTSVTNYFKSNTENFTGSSTTVAVQWTNFFGVQTLTATNAQTVTTAATMRIAGNPVAGSNVTITNPYAFYVSSGNTLISGNDHSIVAAGNVWNAFAVSGYQSFAGGSGPTITEQAMARFGAPVFNGDYSPQVTITTSAAVIFDGEPTATGTGGFTPILTNAYTILSKSGKNRFMGDLLMGTYNTAIAQNATGPYLAITGNTTGLPSATPTNNQVGAYFLAGGASNLYMHVNGTGWVLVGGGSTITSVVAGNGLTGGGSSGAVTLDVAAADATISVTANAIAVGVIQNANIRNGGAMTVIGRSALTSGVVADITAADTNNLFLGTASTGANTLSFRALAVADIPSLASLYLVAAGVAGGQTWYGGTAASETAKIISTSHGTKGKVIFGLAGTTAYDEVNERIGIGTASPSYALEVVAATDVMFRTSGSTSPNIRVQRQTGATGIVFSSITFYNGNAINCNNIVNASTGADVDTEMRFGTRNNASGGLILQAMALTSNQNMILGTSTDAASTRLNVVATKTVASGSGEQWNGILFGTSTLTWTGTTGVAEVSYFRVKTPTINGTAALTTLAATVLIEGAPTFSGSATVTDKYALYVKTGRTAFVPAYTVASATGATWDGVLVDSSTLTVTGTTLITQVAMMRMQIPTVVASSGCTLTNASTLVIEGSPAEGSGATITNRYALNIKGGTFRHVATDTIASATSAAWDGFRIVAATLTISGSTAVTTATGVNLASIAAPSYVTAAAVTYAASLYIGGAPSIGSGGGSIANAYALWVDAGASRFDGSVSVAQFATTPFTLTDAATIAVDASLGNEGRVTLTASRTMGAPTNPIDGQVLVFCITQGGSGGYTITWNSVYLFSSDLAAPILSTAVGAYDVVAFRYNGAKAKWLHLGDRLGYS